MSQEDLALPFLKVLGQLSPEVNTRHAKHIKGAEPGMILNTVTNELHDGAKGISVIPCYYKREFVEWKDRGESMGAPVGVHAANSDVVSSAKRDNMNKDRLPCTIHFTWFCPTIKCCAKHLSLCNKTVKNRKVYNDRSLYTLLMY